MRRPAGPGPSTSTLHSYGPSSARNGSSGPYAEWAMQPTSWQPMTARPPETDESTAYTVMLQRPPVNQLARQRVTLGTQVALLVTGVTALTVLLAGLVLLGLVKGAAE